MQASVASRLLLSFNQVVQGSSPCQPTNNISDLRDNMWGLKRVLGARVFEKALQALNQLCQNLSIFEPHQAL